jgi:hypothetical protein
MTSPTEHSITEATAASNAASGNGSCSATAATTVVGTAASSAACSACWRRCGSGALYKHFKGGKQELLRCAIEHELRAIDEVGSVMEMLPLGDLRAEFTLLARWNLGSLERRSALARFVRRDVSRLPAELRDELYDRLVGQAYEQILDWLQSRFGDAAERPDLPALALVLVESISAYHSLRRTFGRTPDSVDDERFIAAWTETALAVARGYGIHDRD